MVVCLANVSYIYTDIIVTSDGTLINRGLGLLGVHSKGTDVTILRDINRDNFKHNLLFITWQTQMIKESKQAALRKGLTKVDSRHSRLVVCHYHLHVHNHITRAGYQRICYVMLMGSNKVEMTVMIVA